MSNYTDVTMIVTAAEAADLNAMLDASGIEGCAGIFAKARPLWPDDAALVYLPDGSIDMANSPPPTHYMATGWLHNDAVALLPESVTGVQA